MVLTIHRGTQEIGGSCVEIKQDGFRLLLDFGKPLVGPGSDNTYDSATTSDMVENNILPDIPDLYESTGSENTAVVLSHVHQDHTGFIGHLHPSIPVWMTRGTLGMLSASQSFLKKIVVPENLHLLPLPFDELEPVKIGPFKVTASLVDHSAPAAVSLLIEAGEKRLLYSGDFRSTGRKGALFYQAIQKEYPSVDALLLEGTMFGRLNERPLTEKQIEDRIHNVLDKHERMTFFIASGQNFDRFVSAFHAAHRAGCILVIDLYISWMLEQMSKFVSPAASFYKREEVRIWDWKRYRDRLNQGGHNEFVETTLQKRIDKEELIENRKRILFATRTSLRFDKILYWLPEKPAADLIWSMWKGYQEGDQLLERLEEKHDISPMQIHTSGHATVSDLQKYANAIKPKYLVPIHTFHGNEFKNVFDNVLKLEDGQSYEF